MYAVTSIWFVRRTRATLRSAEFGFLGVVVYTRVQTPRFWGLPLSAGVFLFSSTCLRPKRVGGATYQVPIEVNSRRATTLAIRWIVGFARARREKTMAERLAGEIMDAANNTGSSVKKREDLFKMAESNRAFSHYRW